MQCEITRNTSNAWRELASDCFRDAHWKAVVLCQAIGAIQITAELTEIYSMLIACIVSDEFSGI